MQTLSNIMVYQIDRRVNIVQKTTSRGVLGLENGFVFVGPIGRDWPGVASALRAGAARLRVAVLNAQRRTAIHGKDRTIS